MTTKATYWLGEYMISITRGLKNAGFLVMVPEGAHDKTLLNHFEVGYH